ncbi:MAG: hypothetical protein COA69_13175 [Robiginitomaculum sp.]|nr:MAG: hypothetical protein COA69_13175 [Robiginitomaculum sp.]
MGLEIKQKSRSQSWQKLLVEESDYRLRIRGVKRERTFRRMYLTVFVSVPAFFLLYCSLFYIGAFIDPGKVVGVSHSQRAETTKQTVSTRPASKPRTLLSPLSDAFALNRIYLRQGQSIQLSYALPKGTQLHAKIKQCKSFPVLEVLKCKFIGEQEKRIRNGNTGILQFTVSEPGFYYFEDEVIALPNTKLKLHHDYSLVWQRS